MAPQFASPASPAGALVGRFLSLGGLRPSDDASDALRLLAVAAALAATLLLARAARALAAWLRQAAALRAIPSAPGASPLIGHVLPLLAAPRAGKGAWDLMEAWSVGAGRRLVRFRVLGTQGVIVNDPVAFKRIFQTRFKAYTKDLAMSYHPFMPILGTGLVTADGDLWQKQRLLMGPALRVDILDGIVGIAQRGAARLADKLEQYRGTGQVVHLEEEFRLLTLQVIGEAILSLPPEECDRVFPQLYLPVMEESNARVLRPYRKYLPTPAWFAYRRRVAALNAFLVDLIRARWAARQAGDAPAADDGDILDRILAAIEAAGTKWSAAIETQLCYEMKTFLLAGHETSAAMLMWSVYELSRDDAARERVVAEADAVFGPRCGGGGGGGDGKQKQQQQQKQQVALSAVAAGTPPGTPLTRAKAAKLLQEQQQQGQQQGQSQQQDQQQDQQQQQQLAGGGGGVARQATRAAVDGMAYTLAVLKEALRRYSVVPVVTRRATEDDTLDGQAIPAGTMLALLLQGVHNQWRQPERFDAGRFMPGGEYDAFDEAVRPYMFVPFIQGPRNCLGQHLALLEARVVLALLTQRFRFAPASALAGRRHPTVIPVASLDGMPCTVE